MDLPAFEQAVFEVSRFATLATGCLCILGIAAATGVWALQRWLKLFGLYGQFLLFVRQRRKR